MVKTIKLFVVTVGLLSMSCVTGHFVTFEEVSKMLPFNATVEYVEISHPLFLYYGVDIWLRKSDGGSRLDLQICPANKFIIGFARSLQRGQCYSFPKIFSDYIINQSTNTAEMIKK